MRVTTHQIKAKIQAVRVHQSQQKKLILFKLFLALNVSTFGQVYDTVKSEYLDGDTYTIAEVTRKQLESEDIKGNRLYWSMSLVARANRKLERYKRALNIVESIPLDSINYEPLYYDIQLLKALIYQESNKYHKADSLYSMWLPDVPKEYSLLLAINYNDYANVRLYYGDIETALEYYKLANYYNQFTTDDRKERRKNLHYSNLANYYLLLENIKEAKFYFDKIDTLSLTTAEMIISYNKIKGKLQLVDHRYDEAYASFIKVRDISTLHGYNNYKNDSVHLSIKTKVLQRAYFISGLIKNLFIFFGFLLYTGFTIYRSKKLQKDLQRKVKVIRNLDKV
jgi:tetratricopeptide (TPR) repeat protein